MNYSGFKPRTVGGVKGTRQGPEQSQRRAQDPAPGAEAAARRAGDAARGQDGTHVRRYFRPFFLQTGNPDCVLN